MCVRVRVCEQSRGHGGVPAYPLVLPDADLPEDINSKYFKKHNLTIKGEGEGLQDTAGLLESVLAHVRAHTCVPTRGNTKRHHTGQLNCAPRARTPPTQNGDKASSATHGADSAVF